MFVTLVEASIEMTRTRRTMPWALEATNKTAASISLTYARRRRFVQMIRRISAPTLVVQGIEDHIVSPTAVEWLCSLRSDWELVQMEDTGHTPHMDAALRFLDVILPWLTTQDDRLKTA